MPVPIIAQAFREGLSSIPYAYSILKTIPWLLLLAALKYFFGGARNSSERLMHSKVVMVTGGTSGIGASVVHELALRGAQVILLTQHAASDIFLIEYIEDLRASTKNELIYAEQVDLSSLFSIRQFATKWIDNAPPRRLDMLILCANTAAPPSRAPRPRTVDGLDEEWQVNYLANFHLLSILSPALRAQPAHRDVRVIFTTCPSYIGAKFDALSLADPAAAAGGGAGAGAGAKIERTKAGTGKIKKPATPSSSGNGNSPNLFGLSKLSLMVFAHSFQKHLNAYKRPDGQPPCTRVLTVDPGSCRTPGMRRWLTRGSLVGLLGYLVTWPIWWLVLKSPHQGAQSVLYAAMEAKFGRGDGGWMVKECRVVDFARTEIADEEAGKRLWEFSQGLIEKQEKEGAVRRTMEKKMEDEMKTSESQGSSGTAKEQTPGSRRSKKTSSK